MAAQRTDENEMRVAMDQLVNMITGLSGQLNQIERQQPILQHRDNHRVSTKINQSLASNLYTTPAMNLMDRWILYLRIITLRKIREYQSHHFMLMEKPYNGYAIKLRQLHS